MAVVAENSLGHIRSSPTGTEDNFLTTGCFGRVLGFASAHPDC